MKSKIFIKESLEKEEFKEFMINKMIIFDVVNKFEFFLLLHMIWIVDDFKQNP